MKAEELSRRRKHILELRRQRRQCEEVAMERAAMVAASFLKRKLPPTGREAYYLSACIEGVSRHRYVPKAQGQYWERRARQWRRFVHAMAKWVKLNRQIERELRALGEGRCEALPKLKGGGRWPRKSSSTKKQRRRK